MAKKASGITKQLNLSDELADFMGKDMASRAQIMKALWAYIKKEDLQDPKDRRSVLPDDVLEPILGGSKISMFKIAGKISDHIVD